MKLAGNGGDQVRITADNKGPILAIATWFLMVTMIFAAVFRTVIKLFIRRKLEADDYTVTAALAFGVGQSIVISISLRDGLGQRESSLNASKLMSIEKTIYAANLLLIMACGMAKISSLLLVFRLGTSKMHKMVTKISVGVVVAWTLSSVLVLAFQCGMPSPWATQNGHCINKFAFWVAIAPFDILTELVVIALPIYMVLRLQLAASKKVAVAVAFGFRIILPILVIVRLGLLNSYYSSSDFTFEFVASGVVTQALISMSITTACIPALKPFLDSFDSGLLNVELKHSGALGSHSYELHSRGKSNINGGSGLGTRTQPEPRERTKYLAAISGSRVRKGSFESGNSDAEMIIKQTHQWTVQYDDCDPVAGVTPAVLSNNPSRVDDRLGSQA